MLKRLLPTVLLVGGGWAMLFHGKEILPASVQQKAVEMARSIPRTGRGAGGSGVYVSPWHVVTNAHVGRTCKGPIHITTAVGATQARLVAWDDDYDLALLQTESPSAYFASLQKGMNTPSPGAPVLTGGYPGTGHGRPVLTQGKVLDMVGDARSGHRFMFTNQLSQGDSGGPAFSSKGNVIGIVAQAGSMNRQPIGIAIGGRALKGRLKAWGVPYTESLGFVTSPNLTIGEAFGRYTALVECTEVDQERRAKLNTIYRGSSEYRPSQDSMMVVNPNAPSAQGTTTTTYTRTYRIEKNGDLVDERTGKALPHVAQPFGDRAPGGPDGGYDAGQYPDDQRNQ